MKCRQSEKSLLRKVVIVKIKQGNFLFSNQEKDKVDHRSIL